MRYHPRRQTQGREGYHGDGGSGEGWTPERPRRGAREEELCLYAERIDLVGLGAERQIDRQC